MSDITLPSNWKVAQINGIGHVRAIDRNSGGFSVVRHCDRWAIADASEYFLRGPSGRLRTFQSATTAINACEKVIADFLTDPTTPPAGEDGQMLYEGYEDFVIEVDRALLRPLDFHTPLHEAIVPAGTKMQSYGRTLSAKEQDKRRSKRKAQRAARKRQRGG